MVDTRGDRFAMNVDGSTHAKRVDAGDHLQRLLRERLDQTPPETSGPTVQLGTLGGLAVHAQAITSIEDEVRVTIPVAHIDVRFLTDDLRRSAPLNLVTRLERHLAETLLVSRNRPAGTRLGRGATETPRRAATAATAASMALSTAAASVNGPSCRPPSDPPRTLLPSRVPSASSTVTCLTQPGPSSQVLVTRSAIAAGRLPDGPRAARSWSFTASESTGPNGL